MTSHTQALFFIQSAFDDYLTSRFLLINNYPLNGAILASLAIEKYLKAILTTLNIKIERLHFDNIGKLKALFDNTQYDVIFKYPDPRFFEILSLAYRFRYLDNIKKEETISFPTLHLLAELDYFVKLVETLIIIEINGKPSETLYKRAIDGFDKRLYEYNWTLNGMTKKELCETEGYFFAKQIDPNKANNIVIESKMCVPYNGQIVLVEIKIEETPPK